MVLTRNHKPALPGLASGWNFSNQPQSFPIFWGFKDVSFSKNFLWDGTTSYSSQPRYSRHSASGREIQGRILGAEFPPRGVSDSDFFRTKFTEMTLLMAHF